MNRRALLRLAGGVIGASLAAPWRAGFAASANVPADASASVSPNPDEAAIRKLFDSLRAAAARGDGKGLLAGFSSRSLTRLAAVRDAARRLSGAAVGKGLSPAERLAAGGLRRAVTPADLNRKGLDEMASAALARRAGLRRDLDRMALGPLRTAGDSASAPLLADGQGTLFSADFVRESGAWKLDLGPSVKRGDLILAGMAAMKGVSEDALIDAILAQVESRMRRGG